MAKKYDDLVLEVAEELELTAKEGDFIRILDTLIEKTPKWTTTPVVVAVNINNIDEIKINAQSVWKYGDRIEVTIWLRAEAVLGGRGVRPEDAISLFIPCANGTRSVDVEEREKLGPCFVLKQRYIAD